MSPQPLKVRLTTGIVVIVLTIIALSVYYLTSYQYRALFFYFGYVPLLILLLIFGNFRVTRQSN